MEQRYFTRNFTRVELAAGARIETDQAQVPGDVANISMNGMFIRTRQQLPVDNTVRVFIYPGADEEIHVQARVLRSSEGGSALKIEKMELDSFVKLRNIISEKCDDQEVIMREVFKVVGNIT